MKKCLNQKKHLQIKNIKYELKKKLTSNNHKPKINFIKWKVYRILYIGSQRIESGSNEN
jgi:hypothetical protein